MRLQRHKKARAQQQTTRNGNSFSGQERQQREWEAQRQTEALERRQHTAETAAQAQQQRNSAKQSGREKAATEDPDTAARRDAALAEMKRAAKEVTGAAEAVWADGWRRRSEGRKKVPRLERSSAERNSQRSGMNGGWQCVRSRMTLQGSAPQGMDARKVVSKRGWWSPRDQWSSGLQSGRFPVTDDPEMKEL
jgi:hypothetical protein